MAPYPCPGAFPPQLQQMARETKPSLISGLLVRTIVATIPSSPSREKQHNNKKGSIQQVTTMIQSYIPRVSLSNLLAT